MLLLLLLLEVFLKLSMCIVLQDDLRVFFSWLMINKMEVAKRENVFLFSQSIVIINIFSYGPVLQ